MNPMHGIRGAIASVSVALSIAACQQTAANSATADRIHPEYDTTGKIPALGVVTVKDGADEVLRGTHERFVVSVDKVRERLLKKRAQQSQQQQ